MRNTQDRTSLKQISLRAYFRIPPSLGPPTRALPWTRRYLNRCVYTFWVRPWQASFTSVIIRIFILFFDRRLTAYAVTELFSRSM